MITTEQIVIGLFCMIVLYRCFSTEYYDYKAYKQSKDSLIPKSQYRMGDYPYEWMYEADAFPLGGNPSIESDETVQ